MNFDLERILRRLKPQKIVTLARRPDSDLEFVDPQELAGPRLLLDTTVYIDVLQHRAPPALRQLLNVRTCEHSAVGLAELTHVFGRLDPKDPRTSGVLAEVQALIEDIPLHRLRAPDVTTWGAAGVLAGILSRVGNFAKGQQQACLNDALIYLQATRLGCAVLTRNLREFDLLNQIVARGRVLFYRTT